MSTLAVPPGPALPPDPPGPVRQVRAVLAFRLATVRGPARRRLMLVSAGVLLLPFAVAAVGLTLPPDRATDALSLMPSAWLAVLVASFLGAATSGGGRSLLPPEQRSAFPWSPAADHLGATILAPLNVAWLVQALGLLALTSWVVGPRSGLVVAELLTVLWVVLATSAGQTLGWVVELVRTTVAGVWVIRGLLVATGAGFLALVAAEDVTTLLNRAPTRFLVSDLVVAGGGNAPAALRLGTELIVATVVLWLAGLPVVALLQRRPARAQAKVELRVHPPRTDSASEFAAMLRIDHASVWRSVPLRRGLLALTAIPALAALAAGLDWSLVPILPGLVASGAGLLFGVNAWCLDGSGAIWRASQPGSPGVELAARTTVIAEMCVLGGLLSVAAASVRAPAVPSGVEFLGLAAAVLVTSAQVVSRCISWSIDRPYAAALRDARDQPAPPGAMAGYAARLSVVTTCSALAVAVLVRTGQTSLLIGISAALLLLSARRTVAAARRWQDPAIRSRVFATVTG